MRRLPSSVILVFSFLISTQTIADETDGPPTGFEAVARLNQVEPMLAATVLSSVPQGDNGLIGRGFSTLALDWKGDCVDYDPNSVVPATGNLSTTFTLDLIDSSEKFRQVTGLTAAASMSMGVYSGDASASYFRNVLSTSFTNYIAGIVTVVTEPMAIKVKGLTPKGFQALKTGPRTFHTMCGDHFASSQVYGGEFIFMLRISSRSNEEYEDIKADVRGSMGNFGSGAASFEQSITRISTKYNLNAKIIRNGLKEEMPTLSPDVIVKYAREFPSKLAANNGAGLKTIRFGLRHYTALEPRAPNLTQQQIEFDRIARDFVSQVEALADLRYLGEHPEEFHSPADQARLTETTSQASNNVDELEKSALLCGSDPFKFCARPKIASLDQSWMPRRVKWINIRVKDGAWQIIGTVPPGASRKVQMRGSWCPWDSGEAWFPPEQCCIKVRYVSPSGAPREHGYPANIAASGGDRIEVHLGDSEYGDNRPHPEHPLQASMY